MANARCRDCRFWDPWSMDRGICRRFPPGVGAMRSDGAGSRSHTMAADWCGEFQSRDPGKEGSPPELAGEE